MIKLFLAFFLSASLAYGADTQISAGYRDFSGGLNDDDASISIAVNESPDLLNVNIDEPIGALTQRNGYLSCGVIPGGVTATNLYEYAKNDGTKNLIVTNNESIWQTSDCITYSTVTTSLSSAAFPRFATALDKLWIVNGSTWPLVWDGTTLTTLDGLNGKPEGFKAKYITYWKSRIWLANTATAPSSIYFTSLVSSTGAIISPDVSSAAWSSLNQIYIARDDGSPLYGVKVYRDNLYAFKETGISRIIFESEYNLSVTKNVSTIGSKFQESIVEMDDGFLRYVGRDGIYAFDGSTVKRLSSKWYQTFKTIKQPSRQELYNLWDTPTDWLLGNLITISTSVSNGAIALSIEDFSDGSYVDGPLWTINGATSAIVSGKLVSGVMPSYPSVQSSKHLGQFKLDWYTGTWATIDTGIIRIVSSVRDIATWISGDIAIYFNRSIGGVQSFSIFNSNGSGSGTRICLDSTHTSLLASNTIYPVVATITGSNISVSIGTTTICNSSLITVPSSSTFFVAQLMDGMGIDNLEFLYKSTGIFTSQITTSTSLSAWKTFETDQTLNGQSLTYEVRTGTSVYNTLLRPWASISPGAIVSTTTDIYSQWRANFSTTDNGVTPLLNTASIGWITGDASRSALSAINYQSRYWMSASTSLNNNYNDLVMVESKSPLSTYAKHNLPISAFTLWNGNLYGAISNTAKIARLDYGATDDGAAIYSYWQSRDEIYDNPIFYKTVNIAVIDYSNTPANTGITISLSPDMGANWQDRTLNISASTLPRNTKKLNYNANTALGFRTKVSNSVLGYGFKIFGVHNFGTQTNFAGN